jgi:hypothetical protein
MPLEVIKATLNVTTQYAHNMYCKRMRKHYKSRFPSLNVHRRREDVATDTIFSDVAGINSGGCKAVHIFVSVLSLVTDVYPVRTDGEFTIIY